ncbi:LysR substrate-binding domain-containing protein [Solimonas soli]|uniref:LysR substrate-binding domain-containing protein n=1 Tax=Solimonas soli TaxID=413479 RepID=UPI0006855481|nr:LysR substrate-binding domain-containing protein [Solimonas soli]
MACRQQRDEQGQCRGRERQAHRLQQRLARQVERLQERNRRHHEHAGDGGAIVDAVRDGLCDIGIASDAMAMNGLETFAFRDDPLVLVAPRGDALAARRTLRFADVLDRDFIGLVDGSALHAHLAEQARAAGANLRYRARLRSFDAVCAMVGQGVGVGIVSLAAAKRCARGSGIVRLKLAEDWAARRLLLCVRRADELPVYAQRPLAHLRGQGAVAAAKRS